MCVWLVGVVDCQCGHLCHQQDKEVLEGCLCKHEGQTAVDCKSNHRLGRGRYKQKRCSDLL